MKTILKNIFFSWDFNLAFIVTLGLFFISPPLISADVLKPIYETGISVLAVIFSVFFAALSILITSGDNEFVRFLDEEGLFKGIILNFKITLILLFISLIISIVYFIDVLPYSESLINYLYSKYQVLVFSFICLYALFASINATMDSIKFAEFRIRYLQIVKKK